MEKRTRGRPRQFDPEKALDRAIAVFSSKGYTGTSLDELKTTVGFDRTRRAGDIIHGMVYHLMVREPHVLGSIQVYRDHYRLARGFVIPSAILAVILPLWEPVAQIQSGIMVGPVNLVAVQLFFLCGLLACITYMTYRERSYRYAAALARAFAVVHQVAAQQVPPVTHAARAA